MMALAPHSDPHPQPTTHQPHTQPLDHPHLTLCSVLLRQFWITVDWCALNGVSWGGTTRHIATIKLRDEMYCSFSDVHRSLLSVQSLAVKVFVYFFLKPF